MEQQKLAALLELEKGISKDVVKGCKQQRNAYETCVQLHEYGTIFSKCAPELDTYKKCLKDTNK